MLAGLTSSLALTVGWQISIHNAVAGGAIMILIAQGVGGSLTLQRHRTPSRPCSSEESGDASWGAAHCVGIRRFGTWTEPWAWWGMGLSYLAPGRLSRCEPQDFGPRPQPRAILQPGSEQQRCRQEASRVTASHTEHDGPIIPMPPLTLPALRQALAIVAPSRLPEMFEDMQKAFVRAGEENSIVPIRMFYRQWGVVVAIERRPETARRLHAAERAMDSEDPLVRAQAVRDAGRIVRAAHREVEGG
jgi:hypothetical protein